MSITHTTPNHRPDETFLGRWQLDPQRSTVEFRARHFWGLGAVKGHFDHYDGRLDLSADPAIELTIEAASVQTGNAKRDRHLRSGDFFDAENHPQIRFVSDSVVQADDTLKIRGRLFARDQSIPLELEALTRRTDDGLELEAATAAPHRELGMRWSPLGTIPPRSELLVKGHLVPATRRAT
jgi:polyisoprenoid-binding protein YceI